MPLPQPFCSLPWCGRAFGEPVHSRKFRVGGKLKRYVYPAMIDMHDIIPRSRGGDRYDLDNNVPLCHDCHMQHHQIANKKLTFDKNKVSRADGLSGELVVEAVWGDYSE
jgi:hypothetical protein